MATLAEMEIRLLGGFIALWNGIESDPRKWCCAKDMRLTYGPMNWGLEAAGGQVVDWLDGFWQRG